MVCCLRHKHMLALQQPQLPDAVCYAECPAKAHVGIMHVAGASCCLLHAPGCCKASLNTPF